MFFDGFLHNDPVQRYPRVPTMPNPHGRGAPVLDLVKMTSLAFEHDGIVVRYHAPSAGPRITQLRKAMIHLPVTIERVMGVTSGYVGIFPKE